jgi:phosphoribosylformimino-5-aminoimidazole carboxamide ribotide isomerase
VELYPAVDILGGKAVRLTQGDYGRKKEYAADPLDAAHRWVDAGARRLHVVDLDGARDGRPVNLAHLERIAGELDVPVQYGGGLRAMPDITAALGAGAARIVLGTAAFLDDGLLHDAIEVHGDRVAVGLDVREGRIAVHGWQERTALSPEAGVDHLIERGVETIVYTNVDSDGMLEGANLDAAREIAAAAAGARLVYSGGIGSLDDLRGLATLRLEGVIVGKALYEGRFTVEEALEVL